MFVYSLDFWLQYKLFMRIPVLNVQSLGIKFENFIHF